jgi:small subunit ribosomal protein S2
MGGVPNLLFVIDTNKEAIAIEEANRLGIPVAAIVDSNCDPDHITFPIPGNDDAGRAIALYCDLIARAAIDGISRAQGDAGVDLGAQEEIHEPVILEAAPAADAGMEDAEAVEPKVADTAASRKRQRTALKPIFEAPSGPSDDLKKIAGVGPVVEAKLKDLGITKFEQIANMSDEDVEKVDAALNFKGRVMRDDWVGQARALTGAA